MSNIRAFEKMLLRERSQGTPHTIEEVRAKFKNYLRDQTSSQGGKRQMKRSLLKPHEAAEYLGVSLSTLSKIESQGKLHPYRTIGGHRRYSIRMLNEYLYGSRQAPTDANHTPRKWP